MVPFTDPPSATYDARADWTAESANPWTDPLLILIPRGPVSFTASDLDRFTRWIAQFGYRRDPGRSPSEYGRFVRHRQLIVAYANTGTLLVQGAYVDATVRLLSTQASEE